MAVVFFKTLIRRDPYEKRSDGAYYSYSHYRSAIAEDCQLRCVYCDVHENEIGGREAMETDHFRPWKRAFAGGIKCFEHLRNEPTNLVHSCGACNGFKRDYWPTEDPQQIYDHEKGWIEPFVESRNVFFTVADDGTVQAIKAPGAYQLKKLRLNRPLLRRLREQRQQRERFNEMAAVFKPQWEAIVASQPGTPNAQTAEQALQMLALVKACLPAVLD